VAGELSAMDEELNAIMTDNVAFWVSCGSLLLSFASFVVALMAKQQARKPHY
jgi:hypothetical protein